MLTRLPCTILSKNKLRNLPPSLRPWKALPVRTMAAGNSSGKDGEYCQASPQWPTPRHPTNIPLNRPQIPRSPIPVISHTLVREGRSLLKKSPRSIRLPKMLMIQPAMAPATTISSYKKTCLLVWVFPANLGISPTAISTVNTPAEDRTPKLIPNIPGKFVYSISLPSLSAVSIKVSSTSLS